MLGNVITVVAIAVMVAGGIYTVAVPIYCFYDLSFPPKERLGLKRIPAPLRHLGIISLAVMATLIAGGWIVLLLSRIFFNPTT